MTSDILLAGMQRLTENGVSWYRIAKDLGVPYQTIFNWKNGKTISNSYKKIVKEYLEKKTFDITTKI